ncbi:hypothetical protein F5Y10DRAFT_266309 [Nemania abortiva]|nr:hypothetical protein F5Y10DRAFT_266309 [Nemania abortiva]
MTVTFTPPLAPLTTVFTPPCPITWLLTSTKVPSQYPPFPTTAPASCDPPSWETYLSQRGFEYYSPAICPSGFYVGPSCIITNPRTAQGFPAIQGDETAAYCIPTGHTCTSDTSDFRGGVWGVSRTDTANGAQVTVGPAIQIRWRDEDLDGLETDPLTPGPRNTIPTVIATSTASEVPAPPDIPTPSTQSTTSSSTSFTTFTTRSTTPVQAGVPDVVTSATSIRKLTTSPLSSSPSSSSSLATPPPPPIPTQESLTSTASSSSSTPDGSQQSSRPGPSTPDNADRSRGGASPSSFTIVAIALIVILSVIIAVYGGYSVLRRYRRYRAGETSEFIVFPGMQVVAAQVASWVRGVRFDGIHLRRRGTDVGMDEKETAASRRKLPDAELGTEGPVPELGSTYARGTEENPAELASPELPALPEPPEPPEPPERSSWMSRVSRMLTVHRKSGRAATPES